MPPASPSLPGIVLAAGFSRRMGECKLLLPLAGRPLAFFALRAALEGGLAPLITVTGPHSPPALCELLAAPLPGEGASDAAPRIAVTAKDAAQGQAASLKAGVRAALDAAPHTPGVMVLLADQPLVSAGLVRALADAFGAAAPQGMSVAPSFEGRRGNPVILHRNLFDAALKLEGDEGARSLLAVTPLRLLPWRDDSCLVDVDSRESYANILQRLA